MAKKIKLAIKKVATCFRCGGDMMERVGPVVVTVSCNKCQAVYTRKRTAR